MKLHAPYTFTGIILSLAVHLALLGLAGTFWKSNFVRETSTAFHAAPLVPAHQIPEKTFTIPPLEILEIPERSVLPEETLPEKRTGSESATYPERYPTLFD